MRRNTLQPPSRRRSASFAALLTLPLLAGCQGGVLDPKGPVGLAQRVILLNSLAIMLAIVIPTLIAALGFAWWFRAGNKRARYRPDFVYSGQLELLIWSAPVLVIIFLGGVIWVGSYRLDPARPLDSDKKAIEVQVVSLDWKWLFIYPEQGVASVNRLVIPAGRPVHFRLTSASVMNTFFVPQLGSMIYTMNGMATQLHLQADAPGSFYGRSGHFSGDGFSRMQFAVEALPQAGFDAWVGQTGDAGDALDAGAYAKLAVQSQDVRPFTYRSVAAGLFDDIVMQHLPPGPGPSHGRGGPGIHNQAEK